MAVVKVFGIWYLVSGLTAFRGERLARERLFSFQTDTGRTGQSKYQILDTASGASYD